MHHPCCYCLCRGGPLFPVEGPGGLCQLCGDVRHKRSHLSGAGAVAAAAMVIPGISGSFVLVLLGIYPSVLKALNTFNIPLLLSLGIRNCHRAFS
ncbi:MAG: undecaprenyl phosphate translocase family protein [Clostridia bacterium]